MVGFNGKKFFVVLDAQSKAWVLESVSEGQTFTLRFRADEDDFDPNDVADLISLHDDFEAANKHLAVIWCANTTTSTAALAFSYIQQAINGGVNIEAIEAGNETYSNGQCQFDFSLYKDGGINSFLIAITGFAGLFALVKLNYPQIPFSLFLAPRPLAYPNGDPTGILAGSQTDTTFNNAVFAYAATESQVHLSIHLYFSQETLELGETITPVIYSPQNSYPGLQAYYGNLWDQSILNFKAQANNYFENSLDYGSSTGKNLYVTEFGYNYVYGEIKNTLGTGLFAFYVWNKYGKDPRVTALCQHNGVSDGAAGMITPAINKDLNPNGYANLRRMDYWAFKAYMEYYDFTVSELPLNLTLSTQGTYYYWYVNSDSTYTSNLSNVIINDGSIVQGYHIWSTSGKVTLWMADGTQPNYEIDGIGIGWGAAPVNSFGVRRIQIAASSPTSASVATAETLLSKVQMMIATKACKVSDYLRVGKCTDDLDYQILVLLNFEFLLCGRDLGCDELDCIECAINEL